AGDREVAHAIGAPRAPGLDVLDLEGDALPAAIGALASPLLQEILPDLVPGQRSLLILQAADFRILQRLEVKPHHFLAQRRDRTITAEPMDPGEDVVQAAFQARGQPSGAAPAVGEPRFPVPARALAAGAADQVAGVDAGPDRLAPMFEVRGEDDLDCRFLE